MLVNKLFNPHGLLNKLNKAGGEALEDMSCNFSIRAKGFKRKRNILKKELRALVDCAKYASEENSEGHRIIREGQYKII